MKFNKTCFDEATEFMRVLQNYQNFLLAKLNQLIFGRWNHLYVNVRSFC